MTRTAIYLFLLALVASALVGVVGSAAPDPISGTAVVDSSVGEWNLVSVFFANLFLTGDLDTRAKPIETTTATPTIPVGTGSISGSKWHDLDGDHKWDANEPTLPGWTIYLEMQAANGSDWLPVGQTTTDANGVYSFTGLAEGHYRVYEVVPSGWEQTFPTNNAGMHNLDISNGHPSWEGLDFGNRGTATATATVTTEATTATPTPITGSIAGAKWHDADGDRLWDGDEEALDGWTIQLEREGTGGVWSPVEQATTGLDGTYAFSGLAEGHYRVSELPKPDWGQTYPEKEGRHEVVIAAGQTTVAGQNFGNMNINDGGGGTSTTTPTPTQTATETPTITETATEEPTATETPTVTGTATEEPTATETPTTTETPTPTPTVMETPTETATPTVTPTVTETVTETPVETATPTPTVTEGRTYTPTPTVTETETATPTPTVTEGRTLTPTPTVTATTTVPVKTTNPTTVPTTVVPTVSPSPTYTVNPGLCPVEPLPEGPTTTITGPAVITDPGFYLLGEGVQDTNLSVWLEVRASNVTIDGMGRTIDGVDGFDTYGIRARADGGLSNVTIRNLTVTDFAYGIALYDANLSRISRVSASSNTYDGIMAVGGNNTTIECSVIHQDDDGINLSATNHTVVANNIVTENVRGSGIHLSQGCEDVTLLTNYILRNDEGIEVEDANNSTIRTNRIGSSRYYGLNLTTARNLTVVDNYFNNKENLRYPTGAFTGTWNLLALGGPNVVGGPYVGGNYWGTPEETGFSDVTPDWNGDGFADGMYVLPRGIGIDRLPLAPSAFLAWFGTVPIHGASFGPVAAEAQPDPSVITGGFAAWTKTYPIGDGLRL